MKLPNQKRLLSIFFICYCAVMMWLLFIRWRGVEVTDYWAQIARRINLIPFRSIGRMLRTLTENPRRDVLSVVIYNLGGNIVMFVPLGFCLPGLWERFRRFWPCMAAVALIMTTVEIVQLLTLRGFCEIDDVMLNVLGAAIGYRLWRIERQKSGEV